MIKDLIRDIANDKISLSQALTRTKLIANTINNITLTAWIKKELEGYEYDDEYLPGYRTIDCELYLKVETARGLSKEFTASYPEAHNAKMSSIFNKFKIRESITLIEEQLKSIKGAVWSVSLPSEVVSSFGSLYAKELVQFRGVITSAKQKFSRVNYHNVLELTKQKLIDTLMELEKEFPDLNDDYQMPNNSESKVSNIVNNNIYGNNNPVNVAAGTNVHQYINSNTISPNDEERLKSYGVEQQEIDELKKIIEANSKDKSSLISKTMKWLGSVSATVAGRGLYEHLPQITEFVHKLIL